MRFWAGARIAFLVIGLGVGLATIKPQIEFQNRVLEAQREIVKERGGDPNQIPIPDAATQEKRARIMAVSIAVIMTAFPLFVGFLLTSRKKKDEIAGWAESAG